MSSHVAGTHLSTPPAEVDPVCGMTVDASSAPALDHAGHQYHFCSEHGRTAFAAAPDRYTGASSSGGPGHRHSDHGGHVYAADDGRVPAQPAAGGAPSAGEVAE